MSKGCTKRNSTRHRSSQPSPTVKKESAVVGPTHMGSLTFSYFIKLTHQTNIITVTKTTTVSIQDLNQFHFLLLIIYTNTATAPTSPLVPLFPSKQHPLPSIPHFLPLSHLSQRRMPYFRPKHPFQQP